MYTQFLDIRKSWVTFLRNGEKIFREFYILIRWGVRR